MACPELLQSLEVQENNAEEFLKLYQCSIDVFDQGLFNGDCSLMQGEMATRFNAEMGVGCCCATSCSAMGRGIRWACVLDGSRGICAELVLVPIEEWWIDEGNCTCGLPLHSTGGAFTSSVARTRNPAHMVETTLIALWACWNWRSVLLGASNAACLFGHNGGNPWNLCHR